jgi:hypothetical protein
MLAIHGCTRNYEQFSSHVMSISRDTQSPLCHMGPTLLSAYLFLISLLYTRCFAAHKIDHLIIKQ